MTNQFDLGKLSSRSIMLLSLTLLGVLGALDSLSGRDLSFSIFYLVPISAVTWYTSRNYGFVMSILGAGVWLLSDRTSAPIDEAISVIDYWNTLVRLGFYLIVVQLLSLLRLRDVRLQELDRLKSKFVADVSHELRTPVANLKLYLDLIERGKPEKRAEYLRTLREQTGRLMALVEDILSLSRLELGAGNLQLKPVDLNAILQQVIEAHRPSAELAGLALNFEPNLELPFIKGEANQLAQVATNLIANAIHYTPAGKVDVNVYRTDSFVCLQVSDTGIGITAEDRSHLFERFYRGRAAAHLSVQGTGLGLSIVKEIVDLHAGEIEVHSQPEAGATFKVFLPVAS
jgi:signal transduction histidine kinase